MAVTNVAYKVCTRNRLKDAHFSDYLTQPRMLQPIMNIGDITTDNDFEVADLVPGDLLPVMTSESDELLIWRGADDAWQRVSVSPSSLAGIAPARAQDRLQLIWKGGEHGRPGINAAVEPTTVDPTLAELALMIVSDWNFEILGTNAIAAASTYYAEGGITLLTAGADLDHTVLVPHLNTDMTPWSSVTWGADNEVRWECLIRTGAAITNCVIWAGLKLTNGSATDPAAGVGVDNDSAFFRYQNGVNTGKWQTNDSDDTRTTDDNTQDSGVTVAINTDYHLAIEIDSSRVPRFFIDGDLVVTGIALETTAALIPYIGIAAQGAGEAKTLYARAQSISRKFNA